MPNVARKMIYAKPGSENAILSFNEKYDNYIGGQCSAPQEGNYLDNLSPVDGKVFCRVNCSIKADVEKALDAAHAARKNWSKTSPADRSSILLDIADRIEANIETLAITETWDNGKPVREALAEDIPLSVDHFRYFAGCIRAEEGRIGEIDSTTVSYQ